MRTPKTRQCRPLTTAEPACRVVTETVSRRAGESALLLHGLVACRRIGPVAEEILDDMRVSLLTRRLEGASKVDLKNRQ
jgi:hypothetical protein